MQETGFVRKEEGCGWRSFAFFWINLNLQWINDIFLIAQHMMFLLLSLRITLSRTKFAQVRL